MCVSSWDFFELPMKNIRTILIMSLQRNVKLYDSEARGNKSILSSKQMEFYTIN